MPTRSAPVTPWLPPAFALFLAASPALAAEDMAPQALTLEARSLRSTVDRETVAEGAVELRQGGLLIRADRLTYRPATDRAVATGSVVIERAGAVYRGRELDLGVRDFSGWFIAPEFDFTLLGTHGRAERVDFDSRTRLRAQQAEYTSCPRTDDGEPAWELRARDLTLDMDANEGIAEQARLRFQGVTILALPKLSFPVTGARKSGWLPPTVGLDSRSGFELSVPYYWNIAPNRDATLAPQLMTRRGFGLDAEFRYLEPEFGGVASIEGLAHDRLAGRSRYLLGWRHDQQLPGGATLALDGLRASDDEWWKDFQRDPRTLTPRLLSARAGIERPWQALGLDFTAYLRAQDWQVLQDIDAPIVVPYARRPQLGLRARGPSGPFELAIEAELNRFERPSGDPLQARSDGWRWHAVGSLALPWRDSGMWVVPQLAFNAAQYRTDTPMVDGRTQASRVIPTLSVDAGLALERQTGDFFGRTLRQTLEPRLLYVNTPYRQQDELPNFDAYGRDFNLNAIYATNAFAGVDRVSDAHQLTAGATSRLLDPDNGAELLRLGAAQRFLFRDQRVAPATDGSVDGPPLEQRVSDVLLFGATSLVPGWALDASLQYNSERSRMSRSVVGATYSPGPFRTISARYRLARDSSEQVELGWQWPVYRGGGSSTGCGGALYTVGRLNYSLPDRRLTDSVLGLEYDAGCWIARVVSERLSTGRTQATTRLLLQLELVGLSRLGSNPLQVLKDNVPGYRLLREERGDRPTAMPVTPP